MKNWNNVISITIKQTSKTIEIIVRAELPSNINPQWHNALFKNNIHSLHARSYIHDEDIDGFWGSIPFIIAISEDIYVNYTDESKKESELIRVDECLISLIDRIKKCYNDIVSLNVIDYTNDIEQRIPNLVNKSKEN